MKLLLGQGVLVLLSVIILYYLFNAPTFLPYMEDGSISWQNIIVLIFFTSIILVNILSILFVLINRYFLKKFLDKKLFSQSFKFAILVTFGILAVFVLNFLHILNIYYGLGLLGIVIVTLFII
jgi:hypothetical protein